MRGTAPSVWRKRMPTAEVINRDFDRLPHPGAFRSDQWVGSSSLISRRAHKFFCFTGSLLFFSFLLCAGLWSLKVLENEEPAGWDSLPLDSCPSAAPSNGHPWTQQAFLSFSLSLFHSFSAFSLLTLASAHHYPDFLFSYELICFEPWYMHLHLSILFVSSQVIIFTNSKRH